MTKRLGICAIALAIPLVAACSQTQLANAPAPAAAGDLDSKPATAMAAEAKAAPAQAQAETGSALGGDRDAKGCIGSAGYTYSHLHGKCIRIFEDGVRLAAKAKTLDATQSAFAVLIPGDDSRAELHMPGHAPAILVRDGDKQAWRDGAYVLARSGKVFTLSDTAGKKLYEGKAR